MIKKIKYKIRKYIYDILSDNILMINTHNTYREAEIRGFNLATEKIMEMLEDEEII